MTDIEQAIQNKLITLRSVSPSDDFVVYKYLEAKGRYNYLLSVAASKGISKASLGTSTNAAYINLKAYERLGAERGYSKEVMEL